MKSLKNISVSLLVACLLLISNAQAVCVSGSVLKKTYNSPNKEITAIGEFAIEINGAEALFTYEGYDGSKQTVLPCKLISGSAEKGTAVFAGSEVYLNLKEAMWSPNSDAYPWKIANIQISDSCN